MANASYKREKNFQTDAGNSTDHSALNAEFDRLAMAVNMLAQQLNILLKDDNTMEAGVVSKDALGNDVLKLMTGTDVLAVQGPKGDVGASFRADYRGLDSERSGFDSQHRGFCFLAMDTGTLSFKLSDAPGNWSQGFQFAKGAKGDKGDHGAKGDPGQNGTSGAVTVVDSSTKYASLIGRSTISARLVLDNGNLSIVLQTV